jgi:hypothetical protein
LAARRSPRWARGPSSCAAAVSPLSVHPLLKLVSTAAAGALDVWVGIITGVALVLGPPPSACSGDLFGKGQVLVVRTSKGRAHPLGQLVGAERAAVGFQDPSLLMDPLRLYRVEPRTLLG